MRKYQLSMRMQYISEEGDPREFRVYADSNNIWETVCAALEELIGVAKSEMGINLPSFGCCEAHSVNGWEVNPIEK